ncbi:putative RNA-directed DNA polymerase [Helianthus annuus]|nr:putative RNA-directed DNA polymerase [Helianthus annuus]
MGFFKATFKEKHYNRPNICCYGIKRLSKENAVFLTDPFKNEEIKRAVFECGADKAPGPDEFNFNFIKRYWNLFELDFYNLLAGFYRKGYIDKRCNSSFITLIPKCKDPVGMKDYRPISLIGVISKTISMVLANRLKKVIGTIISENQTAFLKGRYILDSPLMVNEIIAWIKKVKRKAFLLKIDFEKAYDNACWGFLLNIMGQMGFPDLWCKWVEGVLKSARSAVLVNGSPTFEFSCSKGIRQGDPLSPFLFLLVMEALSSIFCKAGLEGIFKGIQTPNNGPVMSHLFYADDALILGDWDRENLKNVARCLRIFLLMLGP